MKKLIVAVLLAPSAALAHDSLVPHQHPHGASLLPDLATFAVGGLLLTGVWFAARWYFKE